MIALAVTANLRVTDIVECLLVHPALSEALAEYGEERLSSLGPAPNAPLPPHVATR